MSIKHAIKTGKMKKVNGKYEPETRIVSTTAIKAIRLFCCECMGFSGSPGKTLKQEIMNCSAPTCPLYPYRFGKRPNDAPKKQRSLSKQVQNQTI